MNEQYNSLLKLFSAKKISLVAVSKTKPVAEILNLYNEGQRDFGENKVQELQEKVNQLPQDIRWHLIGHLQKNKVKYVASFIHLIQSVDSLDLLIEINKHAQNNNRFISCLLQLHIAKEETKFGLNEVELHELLNTEMYRSLKNIQINGLMGMATNTNDTDVIRNEFKYLKHIFEDIKSKYFSRRNHFIELSMGMSSDYLIAIEEGATMVRIGSLLFGNR